MQVEGTIKFIDTTKEVGTNGFTKRDLVVTTAEDYPQDILIQFVKEKCSILDQYAVGDSVAVGINLRGREWTNPQGEKVYFNTIQGWKIEKYSEGAPASLPAIPIAPDAVQDDLPF